MNYSREFLKQEMVFKIADYMSGELDNEKLFQWFCENYKEFKKYSKVQEEEYSNT